MKCAGKIAVCLAGGLVLNTSLRADDVVLPDNPYAPVVVRNIFGLNPPPVVDPNATPADPPPKITLNGIMSIFGQLQVLFKVADKTPGQDAYILGEGQQQDEIEVTKIDDKAGIVTFNNHGIVQVLPLVAATSSGPAPAPSFTPGSRPMPRMLPGGRGGNTGANGFNNRFGNRSGNLPGSTGSGGNGGSNPAGDNGSNSGNMPTIVQHPQNTMSVLESDAIIEVTRELTKKDVLEGNMPPLPPTEGTPSDATGIGGGP
jgi:hypothetical protein